MDVMYDTCIYICRYGNQDLEKVEQWSPRKIQRVSKSISKLLEAEFSDK